MVNRKSQNSPAIERAKEYGIDLTLNLSMLKRTPTERVQLLQEWMEFTLEIKRTRENILSHKE